MEVLAARKPVKYLLVANAVTYGGDHQARGKIQARVVDELGSSIKISLTIFRRQLLEFLELQLVLRALVINVEVKHELVMYLLPWKYREVVQTTVPVGGILRLIEGHQQNFMPSRAFNSSARHRRDEFRHERTRVSNGSFRFPSENRDDGKKGRRNRRSATGVRLHCQSVSK